jgi:dephospho-CoA kinase
MPATARIGDLAQIDRFVLLGEPGSGKSTVMAQAAADLGVAVVTARDFVDGVRPTGQDRPGRLHRRPGGVQHRRACP